MTKLPLTRTVCVEIDHTERPQMLTEITTDSSVSSTAGKDSDCIRLKQ